MKKSSIVVGQKYVSRDARIREVTKITDEGGEQFVTYRGADGSKGSVYISTFQKWAVGVANGD